MMQKRKKAQPLAIRLGKAYEKVLSGVPIEKVKLDDSDKKILNSCLNLMQSSISAFQLAEATKGEISSGVFAELIRVKKAHRRKSLEEDIYCHKYKKVNRIKVVCK